MKFASFALIGATSAISMAHSERVIRMADANHDGCLEWGEARAAGNQYFHSIHRNVSPAQWSAIYNSWSANAGPEQCMTARMIYHWVNNTPMFDRP